MQHQKIVVPAGYFSVEEDAAARRRRELRERLLRGEAASVSQTGQIIDTANNTNNDQPSIKLPDAKLAAGTDDFYWYKKRPELLEDEKKAMKHFYPQFQLQELSDGRLSWFGLFEPEDLRPGAKWYLQAVYENNHPDNSNWGGSIKVYSIEPDLEQFYDELDGIPHVLRDSSDQIYICTSRKEDFKASQETSTTAASALAWAAKWIAAFELWIAGDLTTEEFSGHNI